MANLPVHILFCGSRTWSDVGYIDRFLNTLTPSSPAIINGAAPGADAIAAYCARARGMVVRDYPALWTVHGNAAGPIRNTQMLDCEPAISMVAAYTYNLFESRGTFDMVKKSLERNKIVLINPSNMSSMQQVARLYEGNIYICREDAWVAPWRKVG